MLVDVEVEVEVEVSILTGEVILHGKKQLRTALKTLECLSRNVLTDLVNLELELMRDQWVNLFLTAEVIAVVIVHLEVIKEPKISRECKDTIEATRVTIGAIIHMVLIIGAMPDMMVVLEVATLLLD
jgi:hypothetical protein